MSLKRISGTSTLVALMGVAVGCGSTSTELPSDIGEIQSPATGVVKPGTPEAEAVLRVVNESSSEILLKRVQLPETVVANLIAHRLGDDGTEGTADDNPFSSLDELDAVPFVGPEEFNTLLAYAQSIWSPGDPFAPDFCMGAPMTYDEGIKLFQGASKQTEIGRFDIATRTRHCRYEGACEGWKTPGLLRAVLFDNTGYPDNLTPVEFVQFPLQGTLLLERYRNPGYLQMHLQSPAVTFSNGVSIGHRFECGIGGYSSFECESRREPLGSYLVPWWRHSVRVGEHFGVGRPTSRMTTDCVQVLINRSPAAKDVPYDETEVVWYGRFPRN